MAPQRQVDLRAFLQLLAREPQARLRVGDRRFEPAGELVELRADLPRADENCSCLPDEGAGAWA